MKTWTHVQTFIDDRKLPYQVEPWPLFTHTLSVIAS
jgi:hypothetical protein